MTPVHAIPEARRADYGLERGAVAQRAHGPVDRLPFAKDPKSPPPPEAWAYETSRGIFWRKHPAAMVAETPALFPVVRLWHASLHEPFSATDVASLPNHFVQAWNIMLGAEHRKTEREMKARRGGS